MTYGNIVLEIIRQVCTFKNNNQYLMIYEEDFYRKFALSKIITNT